MNAAAVDNIFPLTIGVKRPVVALRSTRRLPQQTRPSVGPGLAALPQGSDDEAQGFAAAGSHRSPASFHVQTAADGEISHIRIGPWRVLSASPERRLAEVRRVGGDRLAVRILRLADGQAAPSSEIWQLYDIAGHLDASLQTTPDGKFAMLTNYRTRQACRMVANEQGALEAVETWRI